MYQIKKAGEEKSSPKYRAGFRKTVWKVNAPASDRILKRTPPDTDKDAGGVFARLKPIQKPTDTPAKNNPTLGHDFFPLVGKLILSVYENPGGSNSLPFFDPKLKSSIY